MDKPPTLLRKRSIYSVLELMLCELGGCSAMARTRISEARSRKIYVVNQIVNSSIRGIVPNGAKIFQVVHWTHMSLWFYWFGFSLIQRLLILCSKSFGTIFARNASEDFAAQYFLTSIERRREQSFSQTSGGSAIGGGHMVAFKIPSIRFQHR